MAKKALVFGERICQIVNPGEEFEVHSDFKWVDVADNTVDNSDTYKDGKVVKALTLAQRRELEDPLHACMEYRMENYPSIYDYIDGVVKNDQDQIDKYIADCKAVKAKYPKPE